MNFKQSGIININQIDGEYQERQIKQKTLKLAFTFLGWAIERAKNYQTSNSLPMLFSIPSAKASNIFLALKTVKQVQK